VAVGRCGVRYAGNDEPEYIQSAEIRGFLFNQRLWWRCLRQQKSERSALGIRCTHQARGKTFQFAVYPSEKAPYGVARSFYLEAINDDAKQSAEQGLMRYLQINTHAG
jgi:hypothetical protein